MTVLALMDGGSIIVRRVRSFAVTNEFGRPLGVAAASACSSVVFSGDCVPVGIGGRAALNRFQQGLDLINVDNVWANFNSSFCFRDGLLFQLN